MKKLATLFLLLCSLAAEAREEVVLTVPKSGTHYLGKIIQIMTGNTVVYPSGTLFKDNYKTYRKAPHTIVIGHTNPSVMETIPENKDVLLLIRDPRDVTLSAISYIDKHGPDVWPGLKKYISHHQWLRLSKKQKISVIIDSHYSSSNSSVASFFEWATTICLEYPCFVVKYEQLSPECNSPTDLVETIQCIGEFLNVELEDSQAESVVKKAFRNKSSRTLNEGKAFAYLEEGKEIVELMKAKLQKYIDFFDYAKPCD